KGTGGSTTGSQSRQRSASESDYAEEPMQTTSQMEETPLQVYETGADDQPIVQTSQHPEWFSQPRKPPSPDRAWNTALPAAQGDAQSWISDLAKQADARSSFNELLDTPIDFSSFIMHRLNQELDRCVRNFGMSERRSDFIKETKRVVWILSTLEAYEADKAILVTYGDSTILKRRREDDDQEGPSAGPNRGSKRQKEGGEQASASTPSEKATKGAGGSITGTQSRQQSTSESAYVEEPVQTTCQMKETPLPVYEIGADDQPIVQTSQHPEWFSQPRKPPSPDRAWNTALPAAQGDAQSWIRDLAKQADARSSFNELLDTPIDFSNFIMHRLNVDTLTPDLLAGPTY
nr:hypothetical protein [Tanacetum cinerariifolium]